MGFDDESGLQVLRERFSEVVEDPAALDPVVKALDAYFARESDAFDVGVDLCMASPFAARVLTALRDVPFGEVTTYGALAKQAGTSARATGGAVGSNPIPVIVPCHRVIAADGSLGGFSAGLHRKRALLSLEGHEDLRGGWSSRRAIRAGY